MAGKGGETETVIEVEEDSQLSLFSTVTQKLSRLEIVCEALENGSN